MGTCTYLLDKEHLPVYPEFEDNTVEMNEEEPSFVQAHEKREKARAEKDAKMPTAEEASQGGGNQVGKLVLLALQKHLRCLHLED